MSVFQFPYKIIDKNDVSSEIQTLLTAAYEAAEKAYAPYSHFKVGAAVLLNNGKVITGANHENAAYPAGVCAERAALSSLDMNEKSITVKAILITYIHGATDDKPLAPCGICRQTIIEVQQWQYRQCLAWHLL